MKTFTVLFLLGMLLSCSTTGKKSDTPDIKHPVEFGVHR